MSEWTYIWMAYGLTWTVMAAYAVYLVRRVRRAKGEGALQADHHAREIVHR